MKVERYTLVSSGQKEAAKQQLYHQISLRKKQNNKPARCILITLVEKNLDFITQTFYSQTKKFFSMGFLMHNMLMLK